MTTLQYAISYTALLAWFALSVAGSYCWMRYALRLNLGWAIIVDVALALVMAFFGGLPWFLLGYWTWKTPPCPPPPPKSQSSPPLPRAFRDEAYRRFLQDHEWDLSPWARNTEDGQRLVRELFDKTFDKCMELYGEFPHRVDHPTRNDKS